MEQVEVLPNNDSMSFHDLAHSVFQNDLLRERILDYVIRDKNKFSFANVRSCRLVNKAWLHYITRCFHKFREPLLHLQLDSDNPLPDFVGEYYKFLDKCTSVVTGASHLEKQIPTFKITIKEDLFCQDNYDRLLECFNFNQMFWSGSSLVDLDVHFPMNSGSLIFTFPHITFPNLKTFKIQFTGTPFLYEFMGRSNSTYLMQLVLSGCKDLQTFVLGSHGEFIDCHGIHRLIVPPSLTTLELNCHWLERKIFKLLVRSDLPNLKKLTLFIAACYSLKNRWIFKVLENFKAGLTHLSLKEENCQALREFDYADEWEEYAVYFRLPKMEHLEHFQSDAYCLKLERGVSMLQNCLPNLQKLSLDNQTISMFYKWIVSSSYISVRELTVSLITDCWDEDSEGSADSKEDEDAAYNFISVRSGMMEHVETAFPNIQKLDITVCGAELDGLQYAFGHLKTLQVLKVRAKKSDGILNSDCWDEILIGCFVASAEALRKKGDIRGYLICETTKKNPSIKNLTELQELVLSAVWDSRQRPQLCSSLISDVASEHAFFEMPKLKKIRLHGRFMVSPAMQKKWTAKSKGVITYEEREFY